MNVKKPYFYTPALHTTPNEDSIENSQQEAESSRISNAISSDPSHDMDHFTSRFENVSQEDLIFSDDNRSIQEPKRYNE